MVRCDVVMANDVSGPLAFRAMERMGVSNVFDPAKVVMVADHFAPAKDARTAELLKGMKEWADGHGVTFYGQGRGGIEHTLLCEEETGLKPPVPATPLRWSPLEPGDEALARVRAGDGIPEP